MDYKGYLYFHYTKTDSPKAAPANYPWMDRKCYSYPVSTRHRFDIHTTSIMLKRRRTDVKTTSRAYWV